MKKKIVFREKFNQKNQRKTCPEMPKKENSKKK